MRSSARADSVARMAARTDESSSGRGRLRHSAPLRTSPRTRPARDRRMTWGTPSIMIVEPSLTGWLRRSLTIWSMSRSRMPLGA